MLCPNEQYLVSVIRVMAGEGGGSVMWLRVEDEDIDEAKHLRVTVSAVEEGKRKKKR